jgi:hypothetical protein
MPLLIIADVTRPGLRDATIRQISKYIAGAFAYAHVSGRYSAYSRRAAVTHDRGDTAWSSVSARSDETDREPGYAPADRLKLYICPATT